MSLRSSFLGIGSVLAILVIPVAADAQVCTSNTDCPQGTTCQVSVVPPTPEPACAPGAVCPKPAALVAGAMSCQPAPCQVDGDCGQGMVCHGDTISACSGGSATGVACPANTPCDALPPPTIVPSTCTTTTTFTCMFPWQLPCNADSDCGGDFVCAPSITGACSGGSGTAPPAMGGGGVAIDVGTTSTGGASGAVAPPTRVDGAVSTSDPPSPCTTTTTFPGYCRAKATSCIADTDCPASWTCVSAPTLVGGSGTGTPSATDAGIMVLPLPPDAVKLCQPPSAYPQRGTVIATDSKGSSPAPDGGSATGGTPPTTPGPTGGAASSGNSTGSSGGCAIAAGDLDSGFAFALGLIGILGLLAAARRRRAEVVHRPFTDCKARP